LSDSEVPHGAEAAAVERELLASLRLLPHKLQSSGYRGRAESGEVIEIAKVPGGYVVHATPPHVKAEWRSERPMAAKDLIVELLGRGAHQTDIGDAFYSADPNWLVSSN
jgi:hypothetical protein